MMTEATKRALVGLRDLSTLQWYVIPILALVFYLYTMEIKRAREGGDWNPLFAALAVFGADFLNESWNGWVLVLSGRSALWTAPGPTALRTTVGWNLEIMFMFAILGFVFYHSLSHKPKAKILGLPEAWFFALLYSAVCVFVECCLNAAGLLVWDYPFWSRSLGGIWLILLVGYFWFFAWAILAITRKTVKGKTLAVALPYAAAIVLDLIAAGLGRRY
jgi:hypothetical protein